MRHRPNWPPLRSATSLDLKTVASWIRSKREPELWAVQSGSILFVEAGVEHCFHQIEEDLKVLVFLPTSGDQRGMASRVAARLA